VKADKRRLLIVDDEPIKRQVMTEELEAAGYEVRVAGNPLEADPLLENGHFDVVVTDLRMPGEDGLPFLRRLRRDRPEQEVMVMTAFGTVDSAVEAMRLGAYDYLQKPFATEELLLKLDRLLRVEGLREENEALRRQLRCGRTETRLVGHSQALAPSWPRCMRSPTPIPRCSSKGSRARGRSWSLGSSTRPVTDAGAPSWRSTARRCPPSWWRPNSSDTRPVPSPVR